MKLQLNDAKFSRTRCTHGCGDGERFVSYTRAEDCTNAVAESFANLERSFGTQVKFPENVESLYVAKGHLSSGGAEVSSGGQRLKVETGGYCGNTDLQDDQNDLLEVVF